MVAAKDSLLAKWRQEAQMVGEGARGPPQGSGAHAFNEGTARPPRCRGIRPCRCASRRRPLCAPAAPSARPPSPNPGAFPAAPPPQLAGRLESAAAAHRGELAARDAELEGARLAAEEAEVGGRGAQTQTGGSAAQPPGAGRLAATQPSGAAWLVGGLQGLGRDQRGRAGAQAPRPSSAPEALKSCKRGRKERLEGANASSLPPQTLQEQRELLSAELLATQAAVEQLEALLRQGAGAGAGGPRLLGAGGVASDEEEAADQVRGGREVVGAGWRLRGGGCGVV
jgi:hypothetical protein